MADYGKNGYIDFSKLWNVLKKKELNKQLYIPQCFY